MVGILVGIVIVIGIGGGTIRSLIKLWRKKQEAAHIKSILSEREIEVFLELLTEKTNLEIAHRMFISVNTVKKHACQIFLKLGIRNRQELMSRYLNNSQAAFLRHPSFRTRGEYRAKHPKAKGAKREALSQSAPIDSPVPAN